jgi:RNA recognition motif-containing protein
MNLYIGNLDYAINEDQINKMFSEFGEVTSVNIITDKYTGRNKGFGFVEMTNDDEAKAAISALNGKVINSREITVNVARPKSDNDNYSNNRRR